MKITYIHHSSFLVETDRLLLLFDYFEGQIPALPADKELIVFASHRHSDHFSPVIFELAERHPGIHYVLSDDIWKKRVPAGCLAQTDFIGPGQTLMLNAGDGVRIKAYKSTDEGVAFAIETEGSSIYHAGDLNDWRWIGEPDDWNNTMHASYIKELQHMKDDGFRPDVAMVPLDGRLETWFYLGVQEFMEIVGADLILPMHFWKDYTVIDRLRNLDCSAEYRGRIADIRMSGQTFVS